MKRILVFVGLFALFFTSNIKAVVEGSLLQIPIVIPNVMKTWDVSPQRINEQLFRDLPLLQDTSAQLSTEIELLRLVDTSV